jgi:cytochrome c oxidase cbb3-type subunit I/II
MPPYPWLISDELDFSVIKGRVEAMVTLGVPYDEAAVAQAEANARRQAKAIAADIAKNGGRTGVETKEIMALVAYLQRLGVDIKASSPKTAMAAQGGIK